MWKEGEEIEEKARGEKVKNPSGNGDNRSLMMEGEWKEKNHFYGYTFKLYINFYNHLNNANFTLKYLPHWFYNIQSIGPMG